MKQFRWTLLILLLLACAAPGWAQQDQMLTQFFSNKLMVNPAYAGSRDAVSFVSFYRHQWAGFPGAPRTSSLSVHSPILRGKSGIGASLVFDKLGIETRLEANVAYAYRIDFGFMRMALGLNGQVFRQHMAWSQSNPINPSDPNISYDRTSIFVPNFGAGIYLDNEHFYASFSIPHILEMDLDFDDDDTEENLAHLNRHYYAMAGMVFKIGNQFKLKPAAMMRYVANAPVQIDINLSGIYKDMVWLGFTFRTGDSYDICLQYHHKNWLRVGYSYDFTFTKLAAYQAGTHEIMLGIDIATKQRGFYHPRYF